VDASTWATCYEKLRRAYQKTDDKEQAKLYFELLQNVPGPVMRLAVDKAIKEEKYWPNPATLRDYCDGAHSDLMLPASSCQRCHGDTWIDAEPIEQFNRTYRNVVTDCPQCWTLPRRGRRSASDA
jgi:hypothetical protein